MPTFAELLKETRRLRRISQTELAEITGITTRSIQNYESGSRMPNSLEITDKLARALDVTVAYLLGEEEEHPYLCSELLPVVRLISVKKTSLKPTVFRRHSPARENSFFCAPSVSP